MKKIICNRSPIRSVGLRAFRISTGTVIHRRKSFRRFSQYSQTNAEILRHTGWTVYVERNIVARSRNDWHHGSVTRCPLRIFEVHVAVNNIKLCKCNRGNALLSSYEIFPTVVKNTIRSSCKAGARVGAAG
jgi:hypothetical protein